MLSFYLFCQKQNINEFDKVSWPINFFFFWRKRPTKKFILVTKKVNDSFLLSIGTYFSTGAVNLFFNFSTTELFIEQK